MISIKIKRATIFVVVFVAAMMPVYVMGLSRNGGLLVANVVTSFVIAAVVAMRFMKKK